MHFNFIKELVMLFKTKIKSEDNLKSSFLKEIVWPWFVLYKTKRIYNTILACRDNSAFLWITRTSKTKRHLHVSHTLHNSSSKTIIRGWNHNPYMNVMRVRILQSTLPRPACSVAAGRAGSEKWHISPFFWTWIFYSMEIYDWENGYF